MATAEAAAPDVPYTIPPGRTEGANPAVQNPGSWHVSSLRPKRLAGHSFEKPISSQQYPLVHRLFIGQEKREEREGESQAIGRTGLLVAGAGRFLHS